MKFVGYKQQFLVPDKMSFFLYIMLLSSILGYSAILADKTRLPLAAMPLLVVASIVNILFYAGLLTILQPIAWLLMGGGWLSGLYYLVNKFKNNTKPFIVDAGIVFFILISLFLWFYTRPQTLNFVDEFIHWGLVSRDIYSTNQLPLTNSAVYFLNYLPGAALFHYWCMQLIGFSEANMYLAQNLLIVSGITVFFSGLNFYKKHLAIYLMAVTVLICILAFGYAFSTLIVEPIMAVTWSACAILFFRSTNKLKTYLLLIPVLTYLYLIKMDALIFVVLLLGYFSLECYIDRHEIPDFNTRKFLITLLLAVASISLAIVVWRFHGMPLRYTSTFSINKLFHLLDNNYDKVVIKNFLAHFLRFGISYMNNGFFIISNKWSLSYNILNITIITILMLLLQGLSLLIIDSKIKRMATIRLYIFSWVSMFAYIILLLFTYLFIFQPAESINVDAFSRYIVAPSLGIILITLSTLIMSYQEALINLLKKITLLILTGIIIVFSLQIPNDFFIILSGKQLYDNHIREYYWPITTTITKLLPKGTKLYVIDQKNPEYAENLRYDFFPLSTQNRCFSLRKVELTDNTRAICYFNAAEFKNRIKNYDYFLLINGDNSFWMSAEGLFPKIYSTKNAIYLFKINHQTGKLTIVATFPQLGNLSDIITFNRLFIRTNYFIIN